MTLTIATDFKTIKLEDPHLVAFKTTPANYTSIILKIYINCCDTEYSKTLASTDLQTDSSFTIDKSFFSFTEDVLPDGVYQFSLEVTTAANVYEQQTNCTLVDQFLGCQVAAYVAQDCTSLIHSVYYLLKQSDKCNCYCSDMCLLYDRILSEIGQEPSVSCKNKTLTSNCSSC